MRPLAAPVGRRRSRFNDQRQYSGAEPARKRMVVLISSTARSRAMSAKATAAASSLWDDEPVQCDSHAERSMGTPNTSGGGVKSPRQFNFSNSIIAKQECPRVSPLFVLLTPIAPGR